MFPALWRRLVISCFLPGTHVRRWRDESDICSCLWWQIIFNVKSSAATCVLNMCRYFWQEGETFPSMFMATKKKDVWHFLLCWKVSPWQLFWVLQPSVSPKSFVESTSWPRHQHNRQSKATAWWTRWRIQLLFPPGVVWDKASFSVRGCCIKLSVCQWCVYSLLLSKPNDSVTLMQYVDIYRKYSSYTDNQFTS